MMKKAKKLLYVLFFVVGALLMAENPSVVSAAEDIMPTAEDNTNINLREYSSLVAIDSGYMRVFYDGEKICIEYYDSGFNIKSKKSVAMELDVWGGFYAGKDAYYVVEGQYNTSENDSAEVIRVIKYNTDWEKIGSAKITGNPDMFGGEVRYPFDYGCVEMTEYDGTLYVVTGHEGYVDESVGQGHQGFLMIAVDEASMSGKIVGSDLWHSFAQYIENDGSTLYVLEQSEGSRYTSLKKIDAATLDTTELSVLDYGGEHTSAWAISCYASVDDMALSSSNILCLGTSIDQSEYDNVTYDTAHNIYLTVTPKSNFSENATTVKWLTDYNGGGKAFLGTKITRVNDNRFMVSWEEYGTEQTASIDDTLSCYILHYVFVDGNGNKISKEYTAAAPISDCHPIVKGSKIVYYASNANIVNFYTIDANSGAFNKKVYRVAGDNVKWSIKNGTLTFSGSGNIDTHTEVFYRRPVSDCSGWYSYYDSDNAWKPIRDNVNKIVIKSGVTGISENSFNYLNNLTNVKISEGVKSIGKEAFAFCNSLAKITIPYSVTDIGEDILWTGYRRTYDGSQVVRAAIYCYSGSNAEKYAKQNNIQYFLIKPKVGETYTVGEMQYKVTKSGTSGNRTVKAANMTGSKGSMTIPETVKINGISYKVTSIANNAFKNNKKLKTITIGKNVTTIGESAFAGCTSLTKVKGCASLKTVEKKAFYNCSKLKQIGSKSSVITLSKVKTIGSSAFYGCKAVRKVNINSKSLTKIGDYAFSKCTGMTSFTCASAKLSVIGKRAFYKDKKLGKITLKTKKLKASKVGKEAFKGVKSGCVFKVPSAKSADYRKIFKNRGAKHLKVNKK